MVPYVYVLDAVLALGGLRLRLALLSLFRLSLVVSTANLLMNLLIQTPSLAAWPIAIYSTSVVDVDTVFCFLLDHETTAPLRKKHFSMTDFLSSGSPAKLLSPYPTRPYGAGCIGELPSERWPYTSSNCIVPLR